MADDPQTQTNDPDAIVEARARVERAKQTGTPNAPEAGPADADPNAKPDAAGAATEPPKPASAGDGTPAPEASAAADAEASQLRQKVAELTKRIQDADGARGGELSKLRNQLAQMNEQMTLIANENKQLRETKENPPAVAPKEDAAGETTAWDADVADAYKGIPEGVVASYGDELPRMVVAIFRNMLAMSNVAPVAAPPTPTPAPAAAPAPASEGEAGGVTSYIDAVEALAPGFATANGNIELKIPPDAKWFAFLESVKDPSESQTTWREALDGKDPEDVAAAFNTYKAIAPADPNPLTPPIEGQEAIDTSRTATPETPGEKPATKVEYDALMKELQFGRGEMPMDTYNQKRERLRQLQEAARTGKMT